MVCILYFFLHNQAQCRLYLYLRKYLQGINNTFWSTRETRLRFIHLQPFTLKRFIASRNSIWFLVQFCISYIHIQTRRQTDTRYLCFILAYFYETFLDGFTHVNIDLEFFLKSSISSKSSGNLEPSVSGSNRDKNPPNTETEIF